ncbi:MAG: type II secretion system protein [Rubrivivax sp.]|nr:MAG: type II secretion system protein [Rubrivivax sp.]
MNRRVEFRRPAGRSRGFTLIEMIMVVMIVGILASAAMPLAALHQRRTQEADLRLALRTLRTAIDAYKTAWDQGRMEKKEGDTGYPPNLDVLVSGVVDIGQAGHRRLYFLRRLPRDPLAAAGLPAAETWALRSYDSPPEAPQPGADVFDVRSRHEGRGLDGTLYQQW